MAGRRGKRLIDLSDEEEAATPAAAPARVRRRAMSRKMLTVSLREGAVRLSGAPKKTTTSCMWRAKEMGAVMRFDRSTSIILTLSHRHSLRRWNCLRMMEKKAVAAAQRRRKEISAPRNHRAATMRSSCHGPRRSRRWKNSTKMRPKSSSAMLFATFYSGTRPSSRSGELRSATRSVWSSLNCLGDICTHLCL